MKTFVYSLLSISLLSATRLPAGVEIYTNFIRQVQFPSGLEWDASVAQAGQRPSDLAIDPGGARFELHTLQSSTATTFLLASSYVGTYIPLSTVTIRTEDTAAPVVRTRADRPFYVDVKVEGLLNGATDPEPSKKVKFLRHVQSYGPGGTNVGIDRNQALLLEQSYITANGIRNLTFLVNSVPGADRSKVRGEERFSVFSLADFQAPESQLAAQTIQIWPVADGSIAGIAANDLIRFALPPLTLTFNDLYPESKIYAQVYKGNPALGTVGTRLPGSEKTFSDSVPQSIVLSLTDQDYAKAFDSDGRWTLELVTVTPFGADRLAHVSFDVDRIMEVNSTVTTIE